MFKQFIIGFLSSVTAHRLFPPPTNNGKSRGGGCLIRLLATLIFIGLLCWALGYALVVAPTSTLLTLYAGLKYLAANGFIALDKLFHPGFDIPAPLAWGGWGLVGGAALRGYRELRGHKRKGMGVLTALAPLLLLLLTGTIRSVDISDAFDNKPTKLVENRTSEPQKRPLQPTKPAPTPINPTEQERRTPEHTKRQRDSASPLPVNPTETKRVPAQQNTTTTSREMPKPASPSTPENMVLIPAGDFQMGSNESDDEKPVHTVYIDAFYMDKYEVTNAQYKIFIQANPQWQKGRISEQYHDGDYLKDWNGNNYPNGKADHPASFVSWYGAMAYAKWIGKRLPTESEWEKAARGVLVGKKYPWGDYINSNKANYSKAMDGTIPVGSYPDNYGLYDMAGNVMEWCLDLYDADFYVSSPLQNPIAGASVLNVTTNFKKVRTQRVLRGGAWNSVPQYTRVAKRTKADPKLSHATAGFRCVQAVTSTMTKTTTTDTEQKTTTHRTPVPTTDILNAAPKSRIFKVWVDHNQYQDSVKGMRIHVKFNVHNFKGANGRVVAYFYKKNGDPLKDTNGRYNTTSGNVSTSGNFQPSHLKSIYNDYTLFMPNKELHLVGGKHNLKFRIKIFKFNKSGPWDALSDSSDWVHFTYGP